MTTYHCPVCESLLLQPFLQRKQVPVHQNLVINCREAARTVMQGELDMVACACCGFVFNRAFDLSKLTYGEDYDNTQSCSAHFDDYMDGLVHTLVVERGVRNCVIAEVGCGKGQFLRKLVSFPGSNNQGYGFDPSYVGLDSDLAGRLTFKRCYYDDSCTDVAVDVVVCRHVIEHVPEPMILLQSVRAALVRSPKARVFFETPCVEWIFRNKVVWDFFYEHCSLFSAASLTSAFGGAGFVVERVEHIFGGQYLWLEARLDDTLVPAVQSHPDTAVLAKIYREEEKILTRHWLAKLESLKSTGKIALWGAGAKGATFANLVDHTGVLLDCVVDVNPNKQGRYIPGTGHPIVAPADLNHRGVTSALLMNPNYRSEVQRLVADAGIELKLIDWSKQ